MEPSNDTTRTCVWRSCVRAGEPTSDHRCSECGIPTEPFATYAGVALGAAAILLEQRPVKRAMIVTTNDVPLHRITKVHGDAFGLVVMSRDYFSKLGASLRTIVGGEVRGQRLHRAPHAQPQRGAHPPLDRDDRSWRQRRCRVPLRLQRDRRRYERSRGVWNRCLDRTPGRRDPGRQGGARLTVTMVGITGSTPPTLGNVRRCPCLRSSVVSGSGSPATGRGRSASSRRTSGSLNRACITLPADCSIVCTRSRPSESPAT